MTLPLTNPIVNKYLDVADSLILVLKQDGYDVRSASDGKSAMALLNGWEPGVVILNYKAADLDGYDLVERLCEESKRRPLLVGVSDAPAKGFDHHLLKPVDPCEQIKLLREHASTASEAARGLRDAGARRRCGSP
jgi:DNA-binding response OmpR family regulator